MIHNEYAQGNPRINRQDRRNVTFSGYAYPKISQQYTPATHTEAVHCQGVLHPCLWPLKAPESTLGGGSSNLSSARWCQYPVFTVRVGEHNFNIKIYNNNNNNRGRTVIQHATRWHIITGFTTDTSKHRDALSKKHKKQQTEYHRTMYYLLGLNIRTCHILTYQHSYDLVVYPGRKIP